jgi:hypothetical protein
MLKRYYAMAVIGLLLLLSGCSNDNAPTTAPGAGPRSAGRAPALATTTTHTQHKALTARADFSDIDESGCVETAVFVFAAEQTSKAADSMAVGPSGKPVTGVFLFVLVSQFNFCTFEFLRSLSGSGMEASFHVDRVKLSDAQLKATILAFDDFTQAEVPVEVDLTWTATGEPLSLSERFRQKQPGLLFSSFFKGTSRDAAATGTVLVGGENLTPNVSIDAEIIRSREGTVSIVKTRDQVALGTGVR